MPRGTDIDRIKMREQKLIKDSWITSTKTTDLVIITNANTQKNIPDENHAFMDEELKDL